METAQASQPQYEVLLCPSGRLLPDFGELWAYRGLFWTLASRTIIARYKQTLVGILWAFAQPLMMMVVLTVLFRRIAKMSSSTPLMVLAGVVAWQLFANSLMASTQSTVAYSKMISKVYFPRMIIPASACLTALVNFLFGAVVFVILMAFYGQVPPWQVVMLPVFILMTLSLSLGAGFWLSALNVKYRDVKQALGYVIMFGMLLSPVGYRRLEVPDEWQTIYSLINPMVPILEGFRWALLGEGEFQPASFLVSAGVCVFVLLTGILYFHRMESKFADVI